MCAELMHGADLGRNSIFVHNSVNLSESPGVTASFCRAFLGVCSSDGLSAEMLAVILSDTPGEAGVSLLKGCRNRL